MRFTKMQGAGNDYVYVDCFQETLPVPPAELAPRIADRHFGVGGDGLVLICPSEVADVRMRMFNADGSESENCGNALRCVGKYVFERGICDKEQLQVETGGKVMSLELLAIDGKIDSVRVDLGEPILIAEKIPTTLTGNSESGAPVDAELSIAGKTMRVTCVSMGNPHCVVYVDELSDDWVLGVGPQLEIDSRFPNRVNVEFVEVIAPDEARQRTWERGSGETLACGTGAAAVCVAGVLSGRTERKVLIHLTGGDLTLEWQKDTNHIIMTGPAVEVFSGEWEEK